MSQHNLLNQILQVGHHSSWMWNLFHKIHSYYHCMMATMLLICSKWDTGPIFNIDQVCFNQIWSIQKQTSSWLCSTLSTCLIRVPTSQSWGYFFSAMWPWTGRKDSIILLLLCHLVVDYFAALDYIWRSSYDHILFRNREKVFECHILASFWPINLTIDDIMLFNHFSILVSVPGWESQCSLEMLCGEFG